VPIYDAVTVRHRKLKTMKAEHIRELCKIAGIKPLSRRSDNVKLLMEKGIDDCTLDQVIRDIYLRESAQRRGGLTLAELAHELEQVQEYQWPCQQGQLDSYIQRNYTRAYVRFTEFKDAVQTGLPSEAIRYATCSWYNTWSTHLIEAYISQHPTVVPTLKDVAGVDVFFKGQAFDVKVTVLPEDYPDDIDDAQANPLDLAVWYFENQSALRFGADNRMFIVVHNRSKPGESWKLKRDISLVAATLDTALTREEVTESDEIIFSYNNESHSTLAKVIFIVRE